MSRVTGRPPIALHRWCAAVMLGTFFALPWLRLQGHPVLLFDLEHRQLFAFGGVWGADHAPRVLMLLLSLSALFYLATALAGRLWCGYLCPQTVLGSLHDRLEKRLGHTAARTCWALLAMVIGVNFVGYFLPIRQLLLSPFQSWGAWSLFWCVFYAAATYFNIQRLRKRLCAQLCPFARLQPWITDDHTPRLRYQAQRGEPRGPRDSHVQDIARRGRRLLNAQTAHDYVLRAANPRLAGDMPRFPADRLGDCTDCQQCVQNCPMGLDIRHGHDDRCLDCGRCALSCDAQMKQCGYPTGLIRRQPSAPTAQSILQRPRRVVALSIFVLATISFCMLVIR